MTVADIVKVWIGINFLVIPGCILWLYYHRRAQWPRSWVLALLGLCLLSCGCSRLLHGFTNGSLASFIFDTLTAISGTILAMMAPNAARVFSRIPSPTEIEHALQGNYQKKMALAMAARAIQDKEVHEAYRVRAENRFKAMEALLNHYPLDPELKERIIHAVKEVNE